MRLPPLLLALALGTGLTSPAMALPIKVYAPKVEAGVLEVEADTIHEDDETETRFELGYGLTRWWRATGVVEVVDTPNAGPRVEAYTVENVVVLPRPAWLPFAWGLYGEYEVGAHGGSADKVELKALFAGEIGKVENRVNLVAEREVGVGAADETEYEYAVQSRYRFSDDFALGLQASGALGSSERFGHLADLEHVIGPIVAGEFHLPGVKSELEFEAAYLVGVTDASPDDVVRLQFEWEKKF